MSSEAVNPDLGGSAYDHIRAGGPGFAEMPRGLIVVWGKEAVQFLDGMITNDIKTLADGAQMLAVFPNAQGRLLALVRVLRQGDRFLIETEDAAREKLYNNLSRFTYAGDFFAEDLSQQYRYFEVFGQMSVLPTTPGVVTLTSNATSGHFVPADQAATFSSALGANEAVEISADLYEVLRIESGIPQYGIDMDENTIVPELGLEDMISYTKGCYVGQEIIARIHFRGHVAKQLTGLMSEAGAVATGLLPGGQLTTDDGKNAGRITSAIFSPKLGKTIALAFVRYDHLQEGTVLKAGDLSATFSKLPFVE